MKLNKILRFTFGAIIALPVGVLIGNELPASQFSERVEYELQNKNLLACGGGGGGGNSAAAKKAKKVKKARAKLSFKKRKLAEAAAAGLPTSDLQSEIQALEALIAED